MSMRRGIVWIPAAAIALVAAGVLARVAAARGGAPQRGATITVRVLSAKVMKLPRFIGPVAGSVARGDQLRVEEVQGDWLRITAAAGAAAGWVHQSSVVDSAVKLSSRPGSATAGASQEEVELAGRGFTPEVEQQYRAKHHDLDFSHVDHIEKVAPGPEEVSSFAQAGKIGGGR
jgi:hypothetical protein